MRIYEFQFSHISLDGKFVRFNPHSVGLRKTLFLFVKTDFRIIPNFRH